MALQLFLITVSVLKKEKFLDYLDQTELEKQALSRS